MCYHDDNDEITIKLVRSLSPATRAADEPIPVAEFTLRLALVLMEYIEHARSHDVRKPGFGTDSFARSKKILATPDEIDAFLAEEVEVYRHTYMDEGDGLRDYTVDPWTGHGIGGWTGHVTPDKVCDRQLWATLRWQMRSMTREFEFATFYFEFFPPKRHGESLMPSQLQPLLWSRKDTNQA